MPGIKTLKLLPLLLAFAMTLSAQQRKYVVGSTIDVVSGSGNNPSSAAGSTPLAAQPFSYFYSLYPSVKLASTGSHNVLGASYAFGLNRTRTQSTADNKSHHGSMTFSRQGLQWKISAAESFQSTADATTFNALRGVTATAEDTGLLLDSPATRQLTRTNTATLAWDYTLTSKSILSVSGEHSLRNYAKSGLQRGTLSNQQSGTGSVNFRRRTSPREMWSAGYTATYLQFADFNNVSSHRATVEYSDQFPSGLILHLTVGATHVGVPKSGAGYIGYETLVSLGKTTPINSFSSSYSQESGQSGGLGSISQTRRATFNVSRSGKIANFFADVAVFDTQGRLENTLNTRGASATANIGFPLTKTLSIQGGAQYQKTYRTTLGFTQRRLFVSLKFNKPDLWTFLR